jgi:hypothetical protein
MLTYRERERERDRGSKETAQALYDYTAAESDELTYADVC